MNIEENIEIVKRFCSLDFLYSNTIVFFKRTIFDISRCHRNSTNSL